MKTNKKVEMLETKLAKLRQSRNIDMAKILETVDELLKEKDRKIKLLESEYADLWRAMEYRNSMYGECL
jgi:hypothetical protein